MTLLFFLLGTVILLFKYNKREGEGCLLFLGHLLYIPAVWMIFLFFFRIKPIIGFISLPIIFIMTLIFNLSFEESIPSKAAGIIGVLTGEIIPSALFVYWIVFIVSFYSINRTYTGFTPENTAAVLSDMHIEDNGTFQMTSILDSRDYFSLHIEAYTPPETFVTELMDKDYYDTEAICEKVLQDFQTAEERNSFGIYDPDGTPVDTVSTSIYLPDYLMDKENIYSSNITSGSVDITFDGKNNTCSIWAHGDHLSHFSENASNIIRNKKDTFQKKLEIVLKDGIE